MAGTLPKLPPNPQRLVSGLTKREHIAVQLLAAMIAGRRTDMSGEVVDNWMMSAIHRADKLLSALNGVQGD